MTGVARADAHECPKEKALLKVACKMQPCSLPGRSIRNWVLLPVLAILVHAPSLGNWGCFLCGYPAPLARVALVEHPCESD